MCARITLTTTTAEIADLFSLITDYEAGPRYNIAPAQSILVIRQGAQGRELVPMQWGLVPRWNTDPRPTGYVNARAETAAEKPAFREAFRSRRCLVPTDGFYEWLHRGKRKQPYLFRKRGGGLFAFAGLWDTWGRATPPLESVAILTTAANELVRPLHDRMPAIIHPDHFDAWLDPTEHDPGRLQCLLQPFPAERMESWPVSERVNSVRVDEPGLTTAVTIPATTNPRWIQPGLFDGVI